MVDELLERGAKVEVEEGRYGSAIAAAMEGGDKKVLALLRRETGPKEEAK
jgi:hypothetical protein